MVGEYVIVEEDVVIGAHCRLEPYVYVKRWTTLGEGNEISAGTVLGITPFRAALSRKAALKSATGITL
jgi:UDP-N-acetylglucosamine acyltransferase